MAPHAALKRRRNEEHVRAPKRVKKVKRQTEYHSSSEDEENPRAPTGPNAVRLGQKHIAQAEEPVAEPVNPTKEAIPEVKEPEDDDASIDTETEANTEANGAQPEASDDDEDADEDADEQEDSDDQSDDVSISDTSTTNTATRKTRKRNDPDVFANSISKILSTKLTTTKRTDPVLSRSKPTTETTQAVADAKLEAKARHKLRSEKREAQDRGHVRDVLGLEDPTQNTAEAMELEKRLRKTAQKGVIKLFNAVRAAQVKGEEAARDAREKGLVGVGRREERVTEMSKQGFLDLIAGGGKK